MGNGRDGGREVLEESRIDGVFLAGVGVLGEKAVHRLASGTLPNRSPLKYRRRMKLRASDMTVNTSPIPNASDGVTSKPNHGRTIRFAVKLMPKPTAILDRKSVV